MLNAVITTVPASASLLSYSLTFIFIIFIFVLESRLRLQFTAEVRTFISHHRASCILTALVSSSSANLDVCGPPTSAVSLLCLYLRQLSTLVSFFLFLLLRLQIYPRQSFLTSFASPSRIYPCQSRPYHFYNLPTSAIRTYVYIYVSLFTSAVSQFFCCYVNYLLSSASRFNYKSNLPMSALSSSIYVWDLPSSASLLRLRSHRRQQGVPPSALYL